MEVHPEESRKAAFRSAAGDLDGWKHQQRTPGHIRLCSVGSGWDCVLWYSCKSFFLVAGRVQESKFETTDREKNWHSYGDRFPICINCVVSRVQCQQIRGIKAENKIIKFEWCHWSKGSVHDPQRILCVSGWRGTGPGQDAPRHTGSPHSFLFSLSLWAFLSVPATVESYHASVTATTCGYLSILSGPLWSSVATSHRS